MNPLSKLVLGAGAAVAVLFGVAFIWLWLSNAHLKTKLAEAEAYSAACHLANDEFSAKVARQNKAVEAMKAQSVAHEKKAQAVAKQARSAAKDFYAAAEKIRKAKVHGDKCVAVETLFNSYLGDK